MSKNLFNRYIWIVDTIRRHGSITREELSRLWEKSTVGDGRPLPRRTFYNYRNAIEELFRINIECNPSTFEYYIDGADAHVASVTDWMLNTASLSNVLSDARDVADRIFLEDVPSSRQFLSPMLTAMREKKTVRFGYSPYSRTGAPKPVDLEPYFLKIFRLRWYVTGLNVREKVIKTYALDRISSLTLLSETFEIPPDFDPEAYFRDSFGIVFSQGKTHKVTLRVTSRQAKYFRALPLHHSQSEMIHDSYSIFNYNLRLTPDFVQELMSYGPNVTVLAPAELRAMIVNNLQQSLKNYEN
ncbi:MAG: WYL domain-containing protein [Paramuribaculum sp.]|nr:WYL domain-containing protein [Paramuribaculum sp.]